MDYVEWIGIVALVKYDLAFLVSLGEAATGDGIFLILGQFLEERKNF